MTTLRELLLEALDQHVHQVGDAVRLPLGVPIDLHDELLGAIEQVFTELPQIVAALQQQFDEDQVIEDDRRLPFREFSTTREPASAPLPDRVNCLLQTLQDLAVELCADFSK